MIKIFNELPKGDVHVALSGGVDSMFAYHFLLKGKRNPIAVFVHHGTENSEKALIFLRDYFNKIERELIVKFLTPVSGSNLEARWREMRYEALSDYPVVVTGHHLDDALETYLLGSIKGRAKVIPYRRGNVVRPFLLNRKKELLLWCIKNNIPWIYDESNDDNSFDRNKVRNNLLPTVFDINPGIYKMITKIYNNK